MSRAELEEELAYLRRSIEDLYNERSAGDVSEADYLRLLARYQNGAEVAEQALADCLETGGPPGESVAGDRDSVRSSRPGPTRSLLSSRRARLVTGWSAFTCFALAAISVVMAVAGVGPFAPAPPLPVDVQVQAMLARASILGARGDVTQALAIYDQVLAIRPEQPEALADGGWLARLAGLAQHNAGLVRNGDAEIEAAVRVDPSYAVARAYDAVMLFRDRHEAKLAVVQLRFMLADHPTATLLSSVRSQAVAVYRAVGLPLPRLIAQAAQARPPRAG
ncbi:MAG: tetratricopeptide repeat protein [Acidimicrobiales bacterium]